MQCREMLPKTLKLNYLSTICHFKFIWIPTWYRPCTCYETRHGDPRRHPSLPRSRDSLGCSLNSPFFFCSYRVQRGRGHRRGTGVPLVAPVINTLAGASPRRPPWPGWYRDRDKRSDIYCKLWVLLLKRCHPPPPCEPRTRTPQARPGSLTGNNLLFMLLFAFIW